MAKSTKPIYKRVWFIVLMVIVVIGVIASIGGGKGSADKAESSSSQTAEEAKDTVSTADQVDGTAANSSEAAKETSTELSSDDSQEAAQATTNSADPSAAQNESSSTAITDIKGAKFHVGDTITTKDLKIVYVSSGVFENYSAYSAPKDGYQYIYIDLYFENIGKSDTSVSMFCFEAYADGYNVEQYFGGDEDFSSTLSPGRYTEGKACFTVPVDASEVEIEYSLNLFSDDKLVFLYEGEQDSGFVPEITVSASADAYHVGDVVDLKDLKITYQECGTWESDNQFIQPVEGYRYVYLMFEVENIGSSDQSISFYSFDCYADGKDMSAVYSRDDALSATLSPGRKAVGTVAFEVPVDASVIEVEYVDNVWTSNRIVFAVELQ